MPPVQPTPELAGAELAGIELAFDAKQYADMVCAATLAVSAVASFGLAVAVSASAKLGAAASPDYTAVSATAGSAQAGFGVYGQVGEVPSFGPSAVWRHTGSASGGYAVATVGAATLDFAGFAQPHNGETDGDGQWYWHGGATAASTARFDGGGAFGFMASPNLQEVQSTSAKQSLAWTRQASVGAVHGFAGYAALGGFTATGRSHAFANIQADDKAKVMAVGRVGEVFGTQASAPMRFDCSGVAGWRVFCDTAANGLARFQGVAASSASADAQALAAWSPQGAAFVSRVREFAAICSLAFDADGMPGASIYSHLPAARARFSVPARMPAFVVTPDRQLQEV